PPPRLPFCGSTGNTLTATVSGGTQPYTFAWTLTGDGRLTGGEDDQTITFDFGSGGITLALTVTDAAGGRVQCSLTASCAPRPKFTTLGQGAYGNGGGYFNGTSTIELTESLLASGDLIVGKPGRSIRIPFSAAGCLSQRLPTNGAPRELP